LKSTRLLRRSISQSKRNSDSIAAALTLTVARSRSDIR